MVPNQHWMFRAWDFGRIQLLGLEVIVFIFGWFAIENPQWGFYVVQGLMLIVMIQNMWLLLPYTGIYKVKKRVKTRESSEKLSILSVNVLQFNTDYQKLIDQVNEIGPDIVFTVESNSEWEQALRVIESEYPNRHKQTLENTYGMHFYSKLEISKATTHFFVSDDIPSFEIDLKMKDGTSFTFFGVHPPPPSPSEEETSKERDGDLLSVAKKVKELNKTVVVAGDFNNVAWARSSQLFRKTSRLIDPRRGYGLVATFHAKYRLLRVPIDLLFHSSDVFIEEFKTLGDIGSDHFPMYCEFYIDRHNPNQEGEIEKEEPGDSEEAEEMIKEGEKENGDRDSVASE